MNKFENSKTNSFKIPPVHKIINLPVAQQLIDRYGHLIVVNAVRDILAEYRYNQKKRSNNNKIISYNDIIKLLKARISSETKDSCLLYTSPSPRD